MSELADIGPIFIVGCPRSGTTLLQRILDAHSEVTIAPETHFMRRFWLNRSRYGDLNADENFRQLVNDVIAAPEFPDYGLQPDELRGAMASCERTMADVFATLLLAIRDSRKARIVGEKTPNHVFFIDQIKALFPSAHFIHIVRDPRSVINSWSRLPWTSGTAWQDAVRWRRHIRAADKYSGASLETIRYEDLVCQPMQSVHRLCQQLGIRYEPDMLNYWDTPLLAFDLAREPWKGRALQPIDKSLATSWRHELTQAEIAQVEAVAWKEILHHGYKLHTPIWMLSGLIPVYFVLTWLDRAKNAAARRVGRAPEQLKSLLLSALLLALVLLAACGGPAPAPTSEPTAPPTVAVEAPPEPTATTPAATATPVPTPEPTAASAPTLTTAPTGEPEPEATATPVDWAEVESETADGFFVRGNPDAPILILDYSDFL